MHKYKFRIEELNPFQEWHLHGTTDNQEQAIQRAKEICKRISRPVRILTAQNKLIAKFEPEKTQSEQQ